jgi:hypothetical protein
VRRSQALRSRIDEAEAANLPSPTHGRPMPLQYLARARLFRDATIGGDAYVNAEMNWTKYALLLQAIELALRAYCNQCFNDGKPRKSLHNHDLKGVYELARTFGLCLNLRTRSTSWARYISTAVRAIP